MIDDYESKIPTGDELFEGAAEFGVSESGFQPTATGADEPNGKGTAGQDAQGRRNKLEDEPNGKGTAGQDAQGRRNKLEDEPNGKGTAGQDAQGRRNKLDEPLGKGTAGQDAQGRRN